MRFHGKSIFPRFIACSSSSAGRDTVGSDISASASLMASGHPLVSGASGKTSGCTEPPVGGWGSGAGAGAAGTAAGDFGAPTADDGFSGLITGADGGGGKGDGAVCGLKAEGTGSGEEGLMGGGGNGTVGSIGVADGAGGVAGFEAIAAPVARRRLGSTRGG